MQQVDSPKTMGVRSVRLCRATESRDEAAQQVPKVAGFLSASTCDMFSILQSVFTRCRPSVMLGLCKPLHGDRCDAHYASQQAP